MKYPGEASYLHGHSGQLTVEIEGELNEHNYAYPVKEAQKLIWEIADNFHHGTIFEEGDPLVLFFKIGLFIYKWWVLNPTF